MIRIVTMNGEIKYQGDVGPRGPKGEKGEQGPIGPVGPQGPAGGDYDDTELRNLIANKVDKEAGKGLFSGNYNDLSNKPTIPTKTSELTNDSSYATETYVTNAIANAQLGGEGGEIDLSGYATKDDLNTKVDKVTGKSLVADTEIERLKNVTNYDDTEIKTALNNKADTNAIPTKTSQLNNDSGFITEHQDISNLATKTELNNKQDKLVAGDNITITGNTISATGGSGGSGNILTFSNIAVDTTSFVEDTTYEEFGYKADITCEGVTADFFSDVTFNVTEALSGNYAPISLTGAGTVTIYAVEQPESTITIPSIICSKGA